MIPCSMVPWCLSRRFHNTLSHPIAELGEESSPPTDIIRLINELSSVQNCEILYVLSILSRQALHKLPTELLNHFSLGRRKYMLIEAWDTKKRHRLECTTEGQLYGRFLLMMVRTTEGENYFIDRICQPRMSTYFRFVAGWYNFEHISSKLSKSLREWDFFLEIVRWNLLHPEYWRAGRRNDLALETNSVGQFSCWWENVNGILRINSNIF